MPQACIYPGQQPQQQSSPGSRPAQEVDDGQTPGALLRPAQVRAILAQSAGVAKSAHATGSTTPHTPPTAGQEGEGPRAQMPRATAPPAPFQQQEIPAGSQEAIQGTTIDGNRQAAAAGVKASAISAVIGSHIARASSGLQQPGLEPAEAFLDQSATRKDHSRHGLLQRNLRTLPDSNPLHLNAAKSATGRRGPGPAQGRLGPSVLLAPPRMAGPQRVTSRTESAPAGNRRSSRKPQVKVHPDVRLPPDAEDRCIMHDHPAAA